ncbi:hypothetical protein ACS0PU_010391 [Formica fusca]
MSAMNRKLDAILAFHDEQNPLVTNNFLDLLPIFPLNSVEDFKKVTTDLNENEELRKQFQKKIRSVGEKTPEHHLINCLVICLTNELAMHLTWESQRQTEGIKNTTFATIITGTISNMYSLSNYYNLNNKFLEWLRRVGDRYRYQLKKLERHT